MVVQPPRLEYAFLFCLAISSTLLARASQGQIPSFEADVKPILEKHCAHCHGGGERENDLDLRTREGMMTGGKTGPAVHPGSLRESLAWSFIATDKMPADDEKLTAAQKDILRRWILGGAPQTAAEAAKLAANAGESSPRGGAKLLGVATMSQRIDELIGDRLEKESIVASNSADDAEFLRRVYLDLNGRVPTLTETTNFLASGDPDKRAKLVETRLNSPEFGQHLAIIWHKLLIPKSAGAYTRIPHEKFRIWLAKQFNDGQGWDHVVTDLITAEGYLPSNKDTANNRKKDAKLQPQNVATAFINVHNTEGRPQPKGIIASVSRLFLAQSIECAQCHNHPLAKWSQNDFWAAAAFFERVRYEKAVYGDTSIGRLMEPAEGKDLIYDDKAKARYAFVKGVYDSPVIELQDANGAGTGEMIRARLLDGDQPELEPKSSYRAEFASWATSTENPYFAKAMTNRVWAHLLGRGFVEPVDDMSEDNRPTHPILLDELSAEFAASEFNVKHLFRCICNSQTYGRTSVPADGNATDNKLFSHQSLKQMTEEQLLASLGVAVPTFEAMLEEDARDKNPGLFRKGFLEVHETPVDGATEHTRGLQQALRMMNGDGRFFNREALSGSVSEKNSIDENIRGVYLQALNRHPTPTELERMSNYVATASAEIDALDPRRIPQRKKDQPDNRPDPYADILWVLINSGEFVFNH